MSDIELLQEIAEHEPALRPSILIVDDEPHVLQAIEDALEDEFDVYVETSGDVALGRLHELPELAVLISDQRMPGMAGDEFLSLASQKSAAARIMITGYADIEAVVKAVNQGRIFGYVTKPWSAEFLKLTIYKAVEHYMLLRGLAHERALLRNLMDNLPDAIFFKDAKRRYVRVNGPQVRRLGADNAEQVVGKRASELVAAEHASQVELEDDGTLMAGEVLTDRVEMQIAPDGGRVWSSTTKAPIRDAGGRITGLVGITRDITASKHLEEVLRVREAALRQAQQLAQVGHFVWHTSTGAISSWSDSVPWILGENPVTMPRTTDEWLARVPMDDRHRVETAHRKAAVSGLALDLEFSLLRPDGHRIVVRECAEPTSADREGAGAWFITVQNVTQIKRAETELKLVLDIGKAIGRASDGNEALGVVLREVCVATAWNYGEVWVRDGDTDALVCCPQWYGDVENLRGFRAESEHMRMAIGEGVPGRVWLNGRPEWCPDVTELQDGRFSRRDAARSVGLKAVLGVPIFGRQRETLAVLVFALDKIAAQDLRLTELVSGIAAHLGEFLQRKLADDELEVRLRQQAAVAELGQLTLRESSADVAMQAAAETLVHTLGVNYCALLEHLPRHNALRFRAGYGWEASPSAGAEELELSETSLAAATLAATEAIVVRDLHSEQRFAAGRLLVEHAVVSGASIVIAGAKAPFGVLGVFSRRLRSFSKDDIHFLTAVANIVAEAVARDQARTTLREREALFALLLSSTAEPIYGIDTDGRCIFANPACARALGFACADDLIGRHMHDLTHHSRSDGTPIHHAQCSICAVVSGSEGAHSDREVFWRRDGGSFAVEYSARPMRRDSGTVGAVVAFQDISERLAKDRRIARLTRMHAMRSGINLTILQVTRKEALFEQACRLAEEKGGFPWVSLDTLDGSGKLTPVVAIDADDLAPQAHGVQQTEHGAQTPPMAYLAVRERHIAVCNDLATDPYRSAFHDQALAKGMRSAAWVPLLQGDMVLGVLTLASQEPGFFDAEELALLQEMSADIGLALGTLQNRRRLEYLANFDALTGLVNRATFLVQLERQIDATRERKGHFALVVLNLNRFRIVNESLGTPAGDGLLCEVASRLVAVDESVSVARMGSDTFAVILDQVASINHAAGGIRKLQRALEPAFELAQREVHASARFGVAIYPADGKGAEQLSANAEAALQKASGTGDGVCFYEAALNARVSERLELETQLRQGLARGEFVLFYQPKIDMRTQRIAGVEGLIRWKHPERGLVPPGVFIPLMEETGLIVDVGAWALRQAVADHAAWTHQGCNAPRIAVNVSVVQLRAADYVQQVREALRGGVMPSGIDLEITESLVMEDIESNLVKLQQLRALGVVLAIDDFGTGYSSLGYLAKLPVQTLKIDRSFIITMLNDPDTMALVSTIIALAHSLRLTVVAEGVDHKDQAKMLRLLRCDQLQGFLFSKPVPFHEITPMLDRVIEAQEAA